MYDQNLETMIRISADLNRKMLKNIPSKAGIQSQTPGYNILARIKTRVSELLARKPVKQIKADYQPVQFQDLDCQSSPTPC
jgi:hypothetical protein